MVAAAGEVEVAREDSINEGGDGSAAGGDGNAKATDGNCSAKGFLKCFRKGHRVTD